MYQTVGHDAMHLQAECLSIPLYREYITGQSIDQALNYTVTKNDETEDLLRLLKTVTEAHPEIEAVSVGAILSNYQRARVENVCGRLGLTCLAYLWQRDQKELLTEMVHAGLTAVVIKVAAIGKRLEKSADPRTEEHSSWEDAWRITANVAKIGCCISSTLLTAERTV